MLSQSGFRLMTNNGITVFLDAGHIGIPYQPGHSHCDALSFELYYNRNPILVNTGVSTYEGGKKRDYQRSTQAHNTVMVGDLDQSEVWGTFRVGRRAIVKRHIDDDMTVKASVKGFYPKKHMHFRTWQKKDYCFEIIDNVIPFDDIECHAYFHCHPNVNPEKIDDNTYKIESLVIKFFKFKTISVEEYQWCSSFNSEFCSKRLVVSFLKGITTSISRLT